MGNPFTRGPSLLLEIKEGHALQCGTTSHTYLPISIPYIHVHMMHNADLLVFPGFPLVAENLHDNG